MVEYTVEVEDLEVGNVETALLNFHNAGVQEFLEKILIQEVARWEQKKEQDKVTFRLRPEIIISKKTQ